MSNPGGLDPETIRGLSEGVGRSFRDRAAARSLRRGRRRPEPPEDGPRVDAQVSAAQGTPPAVPRIEDLLQGLSLLWPTVGKRAATPDAPLPERTALDLEIPFLVTQIAPRRRYAPLLDQVLRVPLQDEDAIRYRQEIVADFLGSKELAQCCRALAEQAVASTESFRIAHEDRPRLFRVAMRLAELQDFVDTADALSAAMAKAATLRSRGLLRLRERLDALEASAWFASLRATVKRLLAEVRDIRSVTVGVNLDSSLRPVEATLLSINRRRFRGSSLLDNILGRSGEAARRGIADLHTLLAQRADMAVPIAPPLFRDLASILDQLARDMERELESFSQPSVEFITGLKQELVFYASAVALVERLGAAGLPVCAPMVAAREGRVTVLVDAYNANLAFRLMERSADAPKTLVRNDVLLEDPPRIAVLTGPNNGGKSVYLQGIGLAQILAQAGMHVPARSATLSVADTVVTHYQTEERPDKEVGRLHEEAARLRDSLASLSRRSLFLSSETFSSTGSTEAAYLLLDVIRALRKLGARAVFSTHLHELAELVERDPVFRTGETQVANLVALFEEDGSEKGGTQGRPTYRVVRAKPRGRSYAQAVARGLGIQYDQLVDGYGRAGKLEPTSREGER